MPTVVAVAGIYLHGIFPLAGNGPEAVLGVGSGLDDHGAVVDRTQVDERNLGWQS